MEGYAAGYARRAQLGESKSNDRKKLLTDRNAYIAYLENHVERFNAAYLEVESLHDEVRLMRGRLDDLEERFDRSHRSSELVKAQTLQQLEVGQSKRHEAFEHVHRLESRGLRLEQALSDSRTAAEADMSRLRNELNLSVQELAQRLDERLRATRERMEVENDLDRILRHSRGKSCSYVCQKYIENPLLIGGARKHDIRQWVMVTALNPLTIYFFSECYVKLAAEDYSLDDFGDRFKHLTHTVIMKNHPNFNPDDEDWRGQWTQDRYRSLLSEKAGYDVWNDKIRPSMQKIVVNSLLSVAEVLSKSENHSCSFQLFGYDFMVDDEYNVWLLEVNDIPMLKASGPVTSRLCDPCLREALGMIFDVDTSPKNEGLRFELLYRGPEIPKLPKTALEFSVDGRKLLPKAIPGPARAPSLRLSARRDQELQDLMDKRRLKEGKEQQEKERQLRLRRSLAKKLLGGKSISSPCLENLKAQPAA